MVNRKYINTDAAISSFIDIAVATGWKNEEKKADILCIQTLCMITKILNKVSASKVLRVRNLFGIRIFGVKII